MQYYEMFFSLHSNIGLVQIKIMQPKISLQGVYINFQAERVVNVVNPERAPKRTTGVRTLMKCNE